MNVYYVTSIEADGKREYILFTPRFFKRLPDAVKQAESWIKETSDYYMGKNGDTKIILNTVNEIINITKSDDVKIPYSLSDDYFFNYTQVKLAIYMNEEKENEILFYIEKAEVHC